MMKSRMARWVVTIVWGVGLALLQAPVQAQKATTSQTVSATPWVVTLDPENPETPEYSCLPEAIYLQGELRSQVTKTVDATGKVQYTHHMLPNHVEGIGLSSGASYKAIGVHNHKGEVLHGGPPPDPTRTFQLAVMQVFNVIGQGQATDFRLFLNARVTVNANGQARGSVEQFRVECQ